MNPDETLSKLCHDIRGSVQVIQTFFAAIQHIDLNDHDVSELYLSAKRSVEKIRKTVEEC